MSLINEATGYICFVFCVTKREIAKTLRKLYSQKAIVSLFSKECGDDTIYSLSKLVEGVNGRSLKFDLDEILKSIASLVKLILGYIQFPSQPILFQCSFFTFL